MYLPASLRLRKSPGVVQGLFNLASQILPAAIVGQAVSGAVRFVCFLSPRLLAHHFLLDRRMVIVAPSALGVEGAAAHVKANAHCMQHRKCIVGPLHIVISSWSGKV